MFNDTFYPTPIKVLEMMNIECLDKTVLDPSAGKGDIIDYCRNNGASNLYSFEINKDLQKIVSSKSNLIGEDFLKATAEQVSHIDVIVMNPPFFNADKHIVHAYDIAGEGTEIYALCNNETLSKDYRYTEINKLIEMYGNSMSLGNCFTTSERKTNVEVGFVRLYKPVISDETKFDGFYTEEEVVNTENGVMTHNEVQNIVNRYVDAVKIFKQIDEKTKELNGVVTDYSELTFVFGYNDKISSVSEFCKSLQVKSWEKVFKKMKLEKYVTSGVMKDINQFCHNQSNIPFTMKNIYRMFDIIVGTRQNSLNKALEQTVDHFTRHTKENRFGVEGWKTNAGHMLNKKFIINNMVETKWVDDGTLNLKYSPYNENINDLIKVLCNLTARNYDNETKIRDVFGNNGLKRGEWYDMSFFKIKCFKKGTVHFQFKDDNEWYLLNKAYGELKGFSLPEQN